MVTPSRWLGKCASESKLFSRFPVQIIPYGFPLDLDTFRPHPKTEIRRALKIPDSVKIILFGADFVVNERKGFRYLLEALNKLPLKNGHDIAILTFGGLPKGIKIPSKYSVVNLGSIADEKQLAMAYSVADVFVLPSLEDNLPNTVIEAMACGVPVVGFDIGGIPDMVEHKKTGYLVKPKDIKGLIEGIDWIISSADSGRNFLRACRSKTEKEYALDVQANAYRDLYERIMTEVGSHGKGIDDSLIGGLDDWGKGEGRRSGVRSQRSEISGQGGSDGWMSTNHLMIELSNQRGGIGSPEKLYQTIQEFIENGKEKEAIGALKVFLGLYPDYALAHNDLGVLYYNKGNKEKALNHYEQASRLEPYNDVFQKNLADFYYVEAGRVEEALQIYVKLLDTNPTDIEILLILGQICMSLKKIDNARVFYNKVLELVPWNVDARERLDELEEGIDDSLIGGFDDWGKVRGQRGED